MDTEWFLASGFDKTNEPMRTVFGRRDSVAISAQEDAMSIDLNFYFSTTKSNSGQNLVNDQFRSKKLHVLPVRLHKSFPSNHHSVESYFFCS